MSLLERTGTYGSYWGDTTDSSHALNDAQMTVNAQYLYRSLASKGWTVNAVAGILGNMQAESTINPGRWQSDIVGNLSDGYGLVQWTPATKYINWATGDYSTMDNNVARIIYEVTNGLQWIPTGAYSDMSFRDFTRSTRSAGDLAKAFVLCYERPADQSAAVQEYRASLATRWYSVISGEGVYVPRLTDEGMRGSMYWYSNTNPFYASGYGLPNCTCYAWGRFWEISDPTHEGLNVPHLPTGDAGTWWNAVQGYDKGSEPALGAVICFPGSPGHVGIVEVINDDGSIITSNSAYSGTYFYLQGENGTLNPSNNYGGAQGFIYNPFAIQPGPGPVIIGKKHKFNFVLLQGRRRRQNIWTRTRYTKR